MKSTLWVMALFFATSLHAADKSSGDTHSYEMVKVVDGDTFDATDGNIKFRVRIAGMDTPEKGSPFSKMAAVELGKRLEGKQITIKPVGRKLDLYNRVLAQVIVDTKDIGVDMIGMGLATYYRPRCVDYPENKKSYEYDPLPYIAAEAKARTQKLYFWSDPKSILPCQVRKNSRD